MRNLLTFGRLPVAILCQRLLLTTALIALLGSVASAQSSRRQGTIEGGQDWHTTWFEVDSGNPGPTVLITGGVHGNEPAGAEAAEQIRHWKIERGRLLVVPKINRLGLIADMRWFPPARNDRQLRDLNRNFPRNLDDAGETQLAAAIWKWVRQQQPDLILDLHEGFDFHISNPKSVGSSIICSKSDRRSRLANQMLEAVNATIDQPDRKFERLDGSGAAKGSLVRSSTDLLDIDGFILETTSGKQPLSRRVRQHRTMVATLLAELEMVDPQAVDWLSRDDKPEMIEVALFDGAGASSNGVKNLGHIFRDDQQVEFCCVGPEDIRAGVLDQFDLVVFPGGSGGGQGRDLGAAGREQVRNFLKQGGGGIGICAGGYLMSSHYDWSLHVINTAVFNKMVDVPDVGRKSMWYRGGPAPIEIEFTELGQSILGTSGQHTVRYQNGPIVSVGKNNSLPPYEVLAWFRSENGKYDAQKGTMVDTPAIIVSRFGSGRIMSISPHPEATDDLKGVINRAVRWVTQPQSEDD